MRTEKVTLWVMGAMVVRGGDAASLVGVGVDVVVGVGVDGVSVAMAKDGRGYTTADAIDAAEVVRRRLSTDRRLLVENAASIGFDSTATSFSSSLSSSGRSIVLERIMVLLVRAVCILVLVIEIGWNNDGDADDGGGGGMGNDKHGSIIIPMVISATTFINIAFM